MYKVFINEKSIQISNINKFHENCIAFENYSIIDKALEMLNQTSASEVILFGDNIEYIWKEFQSYFKIIEAAGGLVKNSRNQFLFIYRLSKWDLPKGKLEKNEGVMEAAIREVEEETGIEQLTITNFIKETYHIYKDKKNRNILKKTYWYAMEHNGCTTPLPQVEEGITKVEWLDKKTVFDSIYNQTYKNIQQVLDQYFK